MILFYTHSMRHAHLAATAITTMSFTTSRGNLAMVVGSGRCRRRSGITNCESESVATGRDRCDALMRVGRPALSDSPCGGNDLPARCLP